jgi:hypothetical protein
MSHTSFKTFEDYLVHFSNIKRNKIARPLYVPVTVAKDIAIVDDTVTIQNVDVDEDSEDGTTILTLQFSDGTSKIVKLPNTSRVDNIESAVNNTSTVIASYIQTQAEATAAVLSQLTNVDTRVTKIEEVV